MQTTDATVRPLFSKDLAGVPGRELSMIAVEYAPGGVDPVHTHHGDLLAEPVSATVTGHQVLLNGLFSCGGQGGEPVLHDRQRQADPFHPVGRGRCRAVIACANVAEMKARTIDIGTNSRERHSG